MARRDPVRIFVADLQGGGAMGVLQVEKLKHLESLTERPLSELFDAFYCASVGAIAGVGLLTPSPEDASKPRYSAAQMADIFYEYLPQYLPYNRWHYPQQFVKALLKRTDLHYDRTIMETTLPKLLGDVMMTDLLGTIVIPSGIIAPGTARPYHFVNFRDGILKGDSVSDRYFSSPAKKAERLEEMRQTPVTTAILATSACPTVFPSYFNDITKAHHVDTAGVASPVSLVHAFTRAANATRGEHPLSFVQFGTAKNFRRLNQARYDRSSFLGLLTGATLDLTSLNVHLSDIETLEALCGPEHVYILDREWDEAQQGPRDILNTNPDRIQALITHAQEEIEQQKEIYDRLAGQLVENRESRNQQDMVPDAAYAPRSDNVRFICVPVSGEDEAIGHIRIDLPRDQLPELRMA